MTVRTAQIGSHPELVDLRKVADLGRISGIARRYFEEIALPRSSADWPYSQGEETGALQVGLVWVVLNMAHNTAPIDLPTLLTSDRITLARDVMGIMDHIDWETGELRDGFLPICRS